MESPSTQASSAGPANSVAPATSQPRTPWLVMLIQRRMPTAEPARQTASPQTEVRRGV
jgi:hypothetical protein